MASFSRQGGSDLVTIVYPGGCREITDDLSSDELIRRLRILAHEFHDLSQAENEATYAHYTPLAIHLADDHFLNHSSRDVQLLVACCIADILRIFAPEAPYKDPLQIKTIFYFLIKQLGGLKDPKDPAFKRYFYLLENLAYVKSFNMCFDLEECSEIIYALFQLIFKIVNDEHSGKVKAIMLEVLSPLITEADFVSNELLDILLIHIVDPLKSQKKNAYALAKDLISKTSITIEPYIQQFFNQVLILGKADSRLQISRKVYELIYELNLISPRILLTVLPQLEFKLKSTDEKERMGSVSLLARMFSEKGSSLARNHRQLWLAYLGRYNDISVAIRIKCVQYTMHFLLNHPELLEDITEALKLRKHDSEEAVRYEVVMAIVSTAKKNLDVVSQSEELLNFVRERCLDKKFKIRKEAVSGLALIYKHHIQSNPADVPEATKKAITWIKDKILHGYYMPGMEDRLLVERLINTCLVPFNLPSLDRMKKLFLLFATIDDNASKAFTEVQRSQHIQVRKAVTELVALHKQEKSETRDKEILASIHNTAKQLPDPVKASEFIRKFSAHMLQDRHVLDLMEKIMQPDTSCAECMKNVNQLLKKLGAPIMTNLYHGTVKQLLERVSCVMIDKEAVENLVCLVKGAIVGDPLSSVVAELGLDPESAPEKGMRLLLLLSFVFPQHFQHKEIVQKVISFLEIERDGIAALTLSVLSFVGKYRPLGDRFPELMPDLVLICKQFVAAGDVKQAKQAIRCLYHNTTTKQEAVFAQLLELVKTNLSPEKGDAYLTSIVALGHIAFHLPDQFPVHIKNLVSRKIVKELLMVDAQEARPQDVEWVEYEDLSLEWRCKLEGLKMMARWLTGLKDDRDDDGGGSAVVNVTISAQKTFRMLNAIIENKGDLLEDGKPSPAERAWFRLAAGCAMIKISEQKGVGDRYNLEQFYMLSTLFVDPVPQVREKILGKLHKGLSRNIVVKCLPLDFMGLYVLMGLETEKRIRNKARGFLTADINKKKDYVKTLMMSGSGAPLDHVSQKLDRILPDYLLVFAVPLLAHLPEFEDPSDVETLRKLQNALWFVMEPLMTKNDNFSFSFYKAIIDEMKTRRDKTAPEDDGVNVKLWTVCDLALSTLITRTSNYELREFPASIRMPPMFYADKKEPNFVNAVSYLPEELMPKNPKKTGLVGHYLRPGGGQVAAAAAAQKGGVAKKQPQTDISTTTTVVVTAAEAEADQQETSAENTESMESESNGTGVVGEGRESKRRGGGGGDGDGGPEEQEQHPAKKIKTEEGTEEPVATTSTGRPRRAVRK